MREEDESKKRKRKYVKWKLKVESATEIGPAPSSSCLHTPLRLPCCLHLLLLLYFFNHLLLPNDILSTEDMFV